MRSLILSLIRPATRILLATRLLLLLVAPAAYAQDVAGDWQQLPDSPVARQPIHALLVDRQGAIWAGAEERGLARWDGEQWQSITTAGGLPDMRVLELFEDSRGRLWVATGTGLGYLPPDRASFRRVGAAGIPAFPITALAEDASGEIWLGTPLGLAGWREDGALEVAGALSGQQVTALAVSPEGGVWAATESGLWHRAPAGWEETRAPPSGPVTQLGFAAGGALHALAGRELWRHDGEGWIAVPLPLRGGVNSFAFAGERLWAAGHGALAAVEGEIAHTYTPAADLSLDATRMAVAGNGAMWLATPSGLITYLPDRIPPVIDEVQVNGAPAHDGAATLARNRIEEIAVTMQGGARSAGPERVTLLAQLDGVDDAPRVIEGALLDAYRDVRLQPGQHILRIWAEDEGFNRSTEKRLTITVPDLTYGPFGIAAPTDVVVPALGWAILLLAAVAAVAVAATLGVRTAAYAAHREATRVRGVLDRAGNPYEVGLGYDTALRAEQARQITETLTAVDGASVLLLGPRGMGKSTLLRQLARPESAGPAAAHLVAAYIDLGDTPERTFFSHALTQLSAALEPHMVGDRPRLEAQVRAAEGYGEREFTADLSRLLAFVRPAAPLTAALLLDNASALDRYGGAQRDAIRRLILGAGARGAPVRLALAAERVPSALEGLADVLRTIELPPLDAPALEHLLLTPAQGAYEWEPDAARGAIALSQGRPGRLREIAERAVLTARRNGRIRILRVDVAPVRSAP